MPLLSFKTFSPILCYSWDITILFTNINCTISCVSCASTVCRGVVFHVYTKHSWKLLHRIGFSLSKELLQGISIHTRMLQFLFSTPKSKFHVLLSAKFECTHVKMTPGEAEKRKCKNKEQILISSNIWYIKQLLTFGFLLLSLKNKLNLFLMSKTQSHNYTF